MKTLYERLSIILGIILSITVLIILFGLKLFLGWFVIILISGLLLAIIVYVLIRLYEWVTEDL
jgi:hypothetical protein